MCIGTAQAAGLPMPQNDPNDFSGKYNTALSKEDEARYLQWAKETGRDRDVYDYDMRGAWLEGQRAGADGHFTDKYKKPNHPTFSDQSQYHGVDGYVGGKWDSDEKGNSRFTVGKTNMMSPEALKEYWGKVERKNTLVDPRNKNRGR